MSVCMQSLVDPTDWGHRGSTPSKNDGLRAGDGMFNLKISLKKKS